MEEPQHISEIIRNKIRLDFSDAPSRTKSEFADDCNINNIVGKAMKTGILPSGNRKPLFEDFSMVSDYVDTQRTIAQAEQNFMQLDPTIREQFGNNVANLLDFIDNPENAEEAAAMGLIAPIAKQEEIPQTIIEPEEVQESASESAS